MSGTLRRHAPALTAVLILLIIVGITLYCSIRANDGHLIYALDDAYVHMAIAKNLAAHGVWGVRPDAFSSASSSILWPLLLAAFFKIVGPNDWAALALNIVFAIGTLWIIQAMLRRGGIGSWLSAFILLAVVLITPMSALAFGGMEHHLQVFATMWFFYVLWRILETHSSKGRDTIELLLAAMLLTLARFEGAFLIFPACIVLFLERRRILSLGIALAGIAPVAVFAAISLSKDWYVLPNSVMVKAAVPQFDTGMHIIQALGQLSLKRIYEAPHMLILVIVAAVFLMQLGQQSPTTNEPVTDGLSRRRSLRSLLFVFILATLLHMQFANYGWFLRYEAYLVCLGITLISMALAMLPWDWRRMSWQGWTTCVVLTFVLIYPLVVRSAWSLIHTVRATQNIYQQQYQMARFLREYYPKSRVAIHDIGAVSYWTDVHILDLGGLSDMDVARLIRSERLQAEEVSNLAQRGGMQIAITYLYPYTPSSWETVARWKMPENIVCAQDTILLMAIEPKEKEALARNVKQFAPTLPRDVVCEFADAPAQHAEMPH